ncbi:MAG: hypothetical protein ACOCQR_00760 [bacterium]
MFKDIGFTVENDPVLTELYVLMNENLNIKRIQTGVYQAEGMFGLNLNHCFNVEIKEEYESFQDEEDLTKWRSNYGVCDNYEQVLERYPELEFSDRNFVVTLCPIRKSEQLKEGGWRWHKWGHYIGEYKPQCEYLYDEPEIDEVLVFHIYEVA